MFIDRVKLNVKSGAGGDGIVAFRREKYVPLGGPAGGDGGKGGDIIFKVDEGLNTLMDFRYNRHLKADNGENGMSKGKHGKNADPLIVSVPPGTVVIDEATGNVMADLINHNEQAVIAKGGRGGRGNIKFASSKNPAPHLSENGEPGEDFTIIVELKLIADVGLVGFPSVGKSTLLSVVSAAKPKIANYHFTTLSPNLGVVETDDQRSFIMADLPGLIEGAHEGVGLGHQFLRHVERTRVLVHVIDMAGSEGRDPYDDYLKINAELKKYDKSIIDKPQIIAANKMDLPNANELLKQFKEKLTDDIPIYPISAYTHDGTRQLLFAVADKLEKIPKQTERTIPETEHAIYRHTEAKAPFVINRESDGAFVLSGEKIERLFHMTDFTHNEAVQRFARQIRSLGVDDELRKRGAEDGDIVRILDFEFEFLE
ncbi:MAG TPA: GTPase ObgE [Bacillota bacterium]|nr:GTPase ObgE [Bacillota bacterium]